MSPTPIYHEPQPDRSGLKTALVAGGLIALVAANIYLYVQLDHVRTDLASARQSFAAEVANLRDASLPREISVHEPLDAADREHDADAQHQQRR